MKKTFLQSCRTLNNSSQDWGSQRQILLCRLSTFLGIILFAAPGYSDATISVEAHPNASRVFLDSGIVTVNYSLPVTFTGSEHDGNGPGAPGAHGLGIELVAGGQLLATHSVQVTDVLSVGTMIYSGTFSFNNPIAQFLDISGSGTFVYEPPQKIPSIYPVFRQWTVLNGQTIIVGGDTPPGLPQTPPALQSPAAPPPTAPSNIHAVIISGLSDPAKVISSPNVTLTGGIVALGKNSSPPSAPSSWSPGLRIVPDYALLTGEKIPPVTPNLLDVRIMRQQVIADFPSPNPQPSN
jgi:hypothetical protein